MVNSKAYGIAATKGDGVTPTEEGIASLVLVICGPFTMMFLAYCLVEKLIRAIRRLANE